MKRSNEQTTAAIFMIISCTIFQEFLQKENDCATNEGGLGAVVGWIIPYNRYGLVGFKIRGEALLEID